LRLKDDDRGEWREGEHDAEQEADHRELREHGDEVRDRQDHQADDDLNRPRAHEEQQEAVDGDRDDENLDRVGPEPGGEEAIGVEVHRARVVARATSKASRARATSCTRKARAPRSHASAHAAAVARSRSSTGRPVAAPRNRLRDGPTTTGYPSPTTVASSSSSRKFCSGVLANPNPGSTTIRSRATPPCSARRAAPASPAATSAATCP